jgi:type IV secretory pathway VirB3-like protein
MLETLPYTREVIQIFCKLAFLLKKSLPQKRNRGFWPAESYVSSKAHLKILKWEQ